MEPLLHHGRPLLQDFLVHLHDLICFFTPDLPLFGLLVFFLEIFVELLRFDMDQVEAVVNVQHLHAHFPDLHFVLLNLLSQSLVAHGLVLAVPNHEVDGCLWSHLALDGLSFLRGELEELLFKRNLVVAVHLPDLVASRDLVWDVHFFFVTGLRPLFVGNRLQVFV